MATSNYSFKVLHLIDSLRTGGAEMLAVNIADGLNRKGIETYLVSTRAEGPLKERWKYPEKYLFLNKKSTLDPVAFWKLYRFIRHNKIDIIHAHSSSFFTAVIMKFFNPNLKIVWHDHYGKSETLEERPAKALKILSRFFDAIISVNKKLKNWAEKNLQAKKVIFLNNFPTISFNKPVKLPGTEKKIIHVAGWRPQKDHHTLLKAFRKVVEKHPGTTLHLIGPAYSDEYEKKVRQLFKDLGLEKSVYIHGTQTAVGDWLKGADVGVLSSLSEGLPVSLLEYGLAGLPVVATAVGEIPAVLENGNYGKLIPPGNADALANAITDYLDNPEEARKTGEAFRRHVQAHYSEEAFMDNLLKLYNELFKQ